MSVLAAIAVFPVLTTLLFALTKAESVLADATVLAAGSNQPAEPPGYDKRASE